MREQLDRVVAEMVDRGVHYDDAQREFERRFISRVVAACRPHGGSRNSGTKVHAAGVCKRRCW